ncbi:hypothetical protein [Agreia sp. COWG]|uniref:hypothetical protein n=1 Tax=Agreia sp. COWG TaxID=2773266 RepID=UPI0019261B14|nr:hypothetical protein [Agreia sp. COWG]CAD6000039.1 conserved membrane protein of unknown function [Agreia sp. COWG]
MPELTSPAPRSTRSKGVGRVLVVVYGILALGATGRSFVQIAGLIRDSQEVSLAYWLSALASVVYIVATVALIAPGRVWYRVAWVTISFELIGVLVVGTLSLTHPELFARPSVWSWYGNGYLFIPLVLPILGMIWLRSRRMGADAASDVA